MPHEASNSLCAYERVSEGACGLYLDAAEGAHKDGRKDDQEARCNHLAQGSLGRNVDALVVVRLDQLLALCAPFLTLVEVEPSRVTQPLHATWVTLISVFVGDTHISV